MEILKVEASQVFVRLPAGMEIWVPKAMLKQYGIPTRGLKVGAKFG